MLKNYFISSFRNLKKERFYTVINTFGLTISIFSVLVLGLYIWDEWSFDKFHQNKELIYRVYEENTGRQFAVTPYAWRDPMIAEFPEIDDAVRILPISTIFKLEGKLFTEPLGIVADTSFFNVFDFELLQGDLQSALVNPNGVLLTPDLVTKYFGNQNPIGQFIEINLFGNTESFAVEGVIESPKNAHIQFDYVLPYERVIANSPNQNAYENWSVHFLYTYLLANKPLDKTDLKTRLNQFLHRHHGEWLSAKYNPQVEQMTEIYLNSDKEFELPIRGSLSNLKILSAVALAILFIGIINFINLSTARAFSKVKSASIRRVYGSSRAQLVSQFLIESYQILLASTIVALVLMQLLSGPITDISDKNLNPASWMDLHTLMILFASWLALGIFIGIYPGWMVASFKPMQLLRGKGNQSKSQITGRKVLAGFQIGASAVLIIGTLIMWSQVDYMGKKSLGFDKDQLLILNDGGLVSSDRVKFNTLKSRIQNKAFFKEISSLSSYPGTSSHWSSRFFLEGDDESSSMSIVTFFTDFDYVNTLGLELVDGRNFDPARPADSINFLINEACLKYFAEKDPRWAEDPFSQTLDWRYNNQKGKVIGIVKDFHFESLKRDIKPAIITEYLPFTGFTGIKVAGENYESIVGEIESVWTALFPNIPFSYTFADETFNTTFQSELKLGKLFIIFASLSILIAMLGLLGLAASMSHEKSKEISIRKVVGASRGNIIGLLIKQFSFIVIVANVVAIPISYLLTNSWLNEFSYRIDWPLQIILISFGSTMLVTIGTIFFHTLKISSLNPVKVLSE
ncbi:MAG: ABC transporter permease [Cyclobacteriaceae bacterium]